MHNDTQLLLLPVRVVIRDLWTLKSGHLWFKSVFLAIIGPHDVNCHRCADFSCHATPYVYILGCVYLTHILQKPCSTTTMAVYAIYEATAKKLEFASGKSCLATLF